MKKVAITLLSLILLLSAASGCAEEPADTTDTTADNSEETLPPAADSPADTRDPISMLAMSVYEIQESWGEMFRESGNSPAERRYRYSVKEFEDIKFSYFTAVRSSYEEKLPTEVILTESYTGSIYGLEIGTSLSSVPDFGWDSAWNVGGTAVYQKDMGDYILTADVDSKASGKAEEYLLSEPDGIVTEIRISRDTSVYSEPQIESVPPVTAENVSGSDELRKLRTNGGNIYFYETDICLPDNSVFLFGRWGGCENTFCISDVELETGYVYTLLPPEGYVNPVIICVQRGLGSGGAVVTVRTEKDGDVEFFDYIFSFNKDALGDITSHTAVYPLDGEHRKGLSYFLSDLNCDYDPVYISSPTLSFDTEYMFDREYMDFTYDLSYLEGIIPDGEIEAWTAKYNISTTAFDRKYRPMLYLAIKQLGVNKADFIRVNDIRKQEGSDKALADRYIDALFLSEDDLNTVRRVLKHPLAYYDFLDNLFCARDAVKSARFGDSAFARERYLCELDRFCRENDVIPPVKDLTGWCRYMPEIVTDEYGIIKKAVVDIGDFDKAAECLSGSIGHPYTLEVTGLCTDVSLYMSNGAHAASITAHGYTIPVSISIYGNCGAYLFDNGGAVVFTGEYYDIGYTHIITENGTEALQPEDRYSLIIRTDSDGNMIWKRTVEGVAGLWQCGDLSSVTGYDTLIYEYGPAEVVDGKIVYRDATERCLATDLDLERIFTTQYAQQYDSLDDLFEDNRKRLEGEEKN
ncbi:MAG: hypothetical protein IKV54_05930 [Clostridia bacterium]|nr:hypothetical protein [Clostridia bacterium]